MNSRTVGLRLPLSAITRSRMVCCRTGQPALRRSAARPGPVAEVEVQGFGQQRQLVDIERQALREGHLVLGLGRRGATTGSTRLQTIISSGSRPAARCFGLERGVALLAELQRGEAVKMTSPQRPAKRRPRPLWPAWITTGWPCGVRGTVNGPRDAKYCPA